MGSRDPGTPARPGRPRLAWLCCLLLLPSAERPFVPGGPLRLLRRHAARPQAVARASSSAAAAERLEELQDELSALRRELLMLRQDYQADLQEKERTIQGLRKRLADAGLEAPTGTAATLQEEAAGGDAPSAGGDAPSMGSDDEIVERHAEYAERSPGGVTGTVAQEKPQHNELQAAAFDEAAEFFASEAATPANVVPLLQRIAAEAVPRDKRATVVDAGCGTGALLPHLLEAGMPDSSYLGVDLSVKMLTFCEEKMDALGARTARLLQGDIADMSKQQAIYKDIPDDSSELHQAGAGTVIFNAVFGNVFDQRETLASAADLLRPGGHIVLSHPLGRAFLDKLKAKDPTRVPHSLPDTEKLRELLVGLPLVVESAEGAEGPPDGSLYLVKLRKVPYAVLPEPFAARGQVLPGRQRGFRSLGASTANLDVSPEELERLERGVYCGWASLRGEVHAAVANVGFAPTFGGGRAKKVLEVHLLDFPDGDLDIVWEEMGLVLGARQRPELTFPGSEALAVTIEEDVAVAKYALSEKPEMQALKTHPSLLSG